MTLHLSNRRLFLLLTFSNHQGIHVHQVRCRLDSLRSRIFMSQHTRRCDGIFNKFQRIGFPITSIHFRNLLTYSIIDMSLKFVIDFEIGVLFQLFLVVLELNNARGTRSGDIVFLSNDSYNVFVGGVGCEDVPLLVFDLVAICTGIISIRLSSRSSTLGILFTTPPLRRKRRHQIHIQLIHLSRRPIPHPTQGYHPIGQTF